MKIDDLLAARFTGANRYTLYAVGAKPDGPSEKVPAVRRYKKGGWMTATERARRSDALHQGSMKRRDLCDRISYLESDMEDLLLFRDTIEGSAKKREPIDLCGVRYVPEGVSR